MTIYLLILVGVIWGAILFLVLRYVHAKIKPFRWASLVTMIFALFGASPILAEYWHYYSFRQYCDINAGWIVNEPVAADRLHVKGWWNNVQDAFYSEHIEKVMFEAQKDSWGPYRLMDDLPDYDRPQCRIKYVGGEIDRLSLSWMAHELSRDHIYLRVDKATDMPDYSLKVFSMPERWTEKYFTSDRTLDTRLVLKDVKSGKVLSDFRSISTRKGPLFRNFSLWPRARYSCIERGWAPYFRHEPEDYDLVKFLDKALLPAAE